MYPMYPASGLVIFGIVSVLTLGSLGCDLLDYSPHQDDLPASAHHLNSENIARIQDQHPGEVVRFAFVADTQNAYRETADFVEHANGRDDLDFVIHGGDIVEYGTIQEYEWMVEIFEQLHVPYVTVVGNHDLRGNGAQIYDHVYGERNFSFVWAGTKFIFLDTNSRHAGFNGRIPDLDWLEEELAPGQHFKQAVVAGHAPPDHPDFDGELERAYADRLEKRKRVVKLSMHGHAHEFRDGRPYGDVLYLLGDNAADRSYLVVSLSGDQITYERVEF